MIMVVFGRAPRAGRENAPSRQVIFPFAGLSVGRPEDLFSRKASPTGTSVGRGSQTKEISAFGRDLVPHGPVIMGNQPCASESDAQSSPLW